MNFNETLKQFSERVQTLKNTAMTEEATKMSLIVPFFQLLGYDVFNPNEFCPEYTADVGIKKGEKVDYAILMNGEPVILIEAKSVTNKLDKYTSQLFRYFVTTTAKFAILTNGIIYKFYTDLDEQNKMDKEPFMELNILNLSEADISQISKLQKQSLDFDEILDTASVMKYTNLFKKQIEQEFLQPSDEMVKLFLQPVYKGVKKQQVIEKFRPILKQALNEQLKEMINSKLQLALDSNDDPITANINNDDEWEALTLIKEILRDTIDVNKVNLKRTESYIAVLFQNNTRKWICRLFLGSNQKSIVLPGDKRFPINDIADIKEHSAEIISAMETILEAKPAQKKYTGPILKTKWGVYEMPEDYNIKLTYGPRQDIKPIN